MQGSKIFKKSSKEPHSPPFVNVFGNGALFTPVVSTLFCVFSFIGVNLHAASILQSIVLNRLQCALLSVPLLLYLTGCGSQAALNHIQVSVHVDACCCGLVPTARSCKKNNHPVYLKRLSSDFCIIL